METAQIPNYQLVHEADTIGLNEKEAFLYFQATIKQQTPPGSKPRKIMSTKTYYTYKKKIKERKQEMVFTIAKDLPEIHITQISSLQLIRKQLYMKFLSEGNSRNLCELAKTLIEIERAIAEWNGWTQKISEETLKRFEHTAEKEESIIHPPGLTV